MLGSWKRFSKLTKKKNPTLFITHCFIHREALMTKTLGTDFNNILSSAVHIINYIRGRPLKSRIFAELCKSMDAGLTTLLYHTEVRWLSRRKVLLRKYELKEEILIFLMSEGQEKDVDLLVDDDWRAGPACLCDIFQHLNILNSSI